jgi:hypothetical protein
MSHKLKGKKSLPENFANTIMELEMDIESGKITSESVNR